MGLLWRHGNWYIRLWHQRREHQLATGLTSKQEAKGVLKSVKDAIKSGDLRRLDNLERRLCEHIMGFPVETPSHEVAVFSRGLPAASEQVEQDDLTLWDAVEIMMRSPAVSSSPNCERHQQVLAYHIIPYFGPGRLIKNMWIPEIEGYLAHRKAQGAAGSTIGKDRSALSVLFRELVKHRRIESNPMEFIDPVDESDGEREVYVSKTDFEAIVARCPHWVQAIVLCLYMTGMRANEALVLTPKRVDLEKRIISLRNHEPKERRAKRVPIHKLLVPILEEIMDGKKPDWPLFMSSRHGAARIDSVRKPWKMAIERAISEQGITEDVRHVTVKDLRHVWITNAMRS